MTHPTPIAYAVSPTGTLTLRQGDLTAWQGEAIVNAANERMLGGGGVDGAIHRAAGPQLLAACREVPEVRPGVRCPTGEARITPAFGALRDRCGHRAILHTVGPIYQSPEHSAPLLASAYRQTLRLANTHGITRLAFPAISCGVYAYPLHEAAEIALTVCAQEVGQIHAIDFVFFSAPPRIAWSEAAARMGWTPR